MTRAELERIRKVLAKAREVLASVSRGESDAAQVDATMAALDDAIESTDPRAPRRPTELGARILEAASEVGLDPDRLDAALRPAIPAGALTRLLYHELRKASLEHVDRVASVIGCEAEWLRTGDGEQRTTPVHPGILMARSLGASEEAIRVVLERDAGAERDEHAWCVAFLEETKRLRTGVPEHAPSSTRLR